MRLEFLSLSIVFNFSLISAKNAVATSLTFGLSSSTRNSINGTLFDTATNARFTSVFNCFKHFQRQRSSFAVDLRPNLFLISNGSPNMPLLI